MRTVNVFLWGLLVLVAFLVACSKSTEPTQDRTPPNIEIMLGVYPISNEFCPVAATYYINPRASSDNISPDNELKARWDFDNDGVWDTDFEEVDSIHDYQPIPIPQPSWFVTCEMKDMAGNSTIKTESILLPSWMPTLPDIVAGEIVLTQDHSGPFASLDTLKAGVEFSMNLRRRDWVNELDATVTQRYFIDDVLIGENSGQAYYPYPDHCHSSGKTITDGISSLGAHEVRIEAILNGGLVESNLENNSASRIVIVVE